jgi:hypothetical protein
MKIADDLFIDTAESSTVKAATYVNLFSRKEGLNEGLRQQGMMGSIDYASIIRCSRHWLVRRPRRSCSVVKRGYGSGSTCSSGSE